MRDGRITEDLKDLDLGISKTSDPLSSLRVETDLQQDHSI